MTPGKVREFFAILREANPTPRSDLEYYSPYTLLVAVVLSAQATDVGVNKATPALFAVADTPEKMAGLGVDRVADLIKTINFYPTKARALVNGARILVEEHGGEVPDSREALMRLPGVGRKSANVVLNVAFGQGAIGVDTHIFRVANRTGLAPAPTPEAVEAELMEIVPEAFLLHAHHWLVLHGRYTCKARKPDCGACLVRDLCGWEGKSE
ncbi:MAG TPA: endonuclease III [Rhodospirillaceae bacterium]|jgi:endonuclease-3|nr:endonuclease III [Alphaproteobacteria bacterium]HBH25876.1 endonuclease III [Rhodospirillaceae bacterium]